MFYLYTLIHLLYSVPERATEQIRRLQAEGDRGSVTLEQVVITVGLFLLATTAVAAIVAAVKGRLNFGP